MKTKNKKTQVKVENYELRQMFVQIKIFLLIAFFLGGTFGFVYGVVFGLDIIMWGGLLVLGLAVVSWVTS